MSWEVDVMQVLILVGALVAALWFGRRGELKELADTRGNRINDLEKEIQVLREDVAEMRGMMEAIQRIKSEEIAVEVVRLLAGRHLVGD